MLINAAGSTTNLFHFSSGVKKWFRREGFRRKPVELLNNTTVGYIEEKEMLLTSNKNIC